MTPGGKMNKYETPWDCMKREFNEETNISLPLHRCKLLSKKQWKDTVVYIIKTNHKFSRNFYQTKESIDFKFIHFSELVNRTINVKSYVHNSFNDLNIESLMIQ